MLVYNGFNNYPILHLWLHVFLASSAKLLNWLVGPTIVASTLVLDTNCKISVHFVIFGNWVRINAKLAQRINILLWVYETGIQGESANELLIFSVNHPEIQVAAKFERCCKVCLNIDLHEVIFSIFIRSKLAWKCSSVILFFFEKTRVVREEHLIRFAVHYFYDKVNFLTCVSGERLDKDFLYEN